ncbi:MAG: PfkB family carbohydrate kinase, partial [Bryocella sp.]
DDIRSSTVFLTQLELPLAVVERGLELARAAGVPTILNPAPAPTQPLPESMIALADFIIPNETEAAILTGMPVEDIAQAKAAAKKLQAMGARNVILTLGSKGALVVTEDGAETIVPSFSAGTVVETTGAGDAFCGGLAAALAEGQPLLEAVRFGCATAGISVTRAGTAPSMPKRQEIEALLAS